MIVNVDDADDKYDEYNNCDTFRDYNAHTQEIDHVEQEAKGAPGLESQTGRRLVSPAAGSEKKNGTHYIPGSKCRFNCSYGTLEFS